MAKESEIREFFYHLIEPIVTIFNELKDLQYFETAANNNYLDTQLMKLAIQTIENTREFKHNIQLWNVKLQVDKSCDNLKMHTKFYAP